MRLAKAIAIFASLFMCLPLIKFCVWGNLKHLLMSKTLSWHSRRLLEALKIKVVADEFPEGSYLIVANHLSYLDIPIIASLKPTLFVTSQELASEPIIGWLARLGECLFVDRKKFTTLLKDLKELSILLDGERTVTLFPEATSTSGNMVPFKPTLISAAMHAGVPILALAIRYPEVTEESKSTVFYYNNMDLLPHLRHRITTPPMKVEVKICGLVDTTIFSHRKKLAEHLFQLISTSTIKYID